METIGVWQTCPHCNGKGKEPTLYGFGLPKYLFSDCTVCLGKKIISTVTGRPLIETPDLLK